MAVVLLLTKDLAEAWEIAILITSFISCTVLSRLTCFLFTHFPLTLLSPRRDGFAGGRSMVSWSYYTCVVTVERPRCGLLLDQHVLPVHSPFDSVATCSAMMDSFGLQKVNIMRAFPQQLSFLFTINIHSDSPLLAASSSKPAFPSISFPSICYTSVLPLSLSTSTTLV